MYDALGEKISDPNWVNRGKLKKNQLLKQLCGQGVGN